LFDTIPISTITQINLHSIQLVQSKRYY